MPRLTIEEFEARQIACAENIIERWFEWNEAPSDYDGAETDALIFALEQYRDLLCMRAEGDV